MIFVQESEDCIHKCLLFLKHVLTGTTQVNSSNATIWNSDLKWRNLSPIGL